MKIQVKFLIKFSVKKHSQNMGCKSWCRLPFRHSRFMVAWNTTKNLANILHKNDCLKLWHGFKFQWHYHFFLSNLVSNVRKIFCGIWWHHKPTVLSLMKILNLKVFPLIRGKTECVKTKMGKMQYLNSCTTLFHYTYYQFTVIWYEP